MDSLFCKQPLFILVPVALLSLLILVYFIKKKFNFSENTNLIFDGVGILSHAIALTAILICGGNLYDALIVVLISGVVSLLLSPKICDKEEK